jgi:hypothetical protein
MVNTVYNAQPAPCGLLYRDVLINRKPLPAHLPVQSKGARKQDLSLAYNPYCITLLHTAGYAAA